jgi:hypothetical protein
MITGDIVERLTTSGAESVVIASPGQQQETSRCLHQNPRLLCPPPARGRDDQAQSPEAHRPGHRLALLQQAEEGAEGLTGHPASGQRHAARASRRSWPGVNWWGAAMADSKVRKQRMRARRQHAGLKAALVWLTAEGQAALSARRRRCHPARGARQKPRRTSGTTTWKGRGCARQPH